MLDAFDDRARRIDASTPPDRNRYADALRTTAIAMVVLGHWVVARIIDHGEFLQVRTVLAVAPETQWISWLFQVMPLFFFVGGMLNALSWQRARRTRTHWADWLRRRARRLLFPLVPLLGTWLAIIFVMEQAGAPRGIPVLASFKAFLPVWFLAAYVFIVALTPPAHYLHRKFGVGVPVALLGLALGADLFVVAGIDEVGWINFVLVWTAVHQLGFFWHDGRLPTRPAAGVGLAILAVGVAVWLVQVADYPLSMVATGEPVRTNDYPPNMALVALAVAQIGVVTALRGPASRLLDRPRPWAAVATAGSRMMTIFLWHMTAVVLIGWALYTTGVWPARDDVDLVWWLLRIPWVALLSVGLAVLIAIFGRFEQPPRPEPIEPEGWLHPLRVAAGIALSALGLTLIVTGGLYAGGGLEGLAWMPLTMVLFGFVALDVVPFPTFELDE